jgi:hypothetical protein
MSGADPIKSSVVIIKPWMSEVRDVRRNGGRG